MDVRVLSETRAVGPLGSTARQFPEKLRGASSDIFLSIL